MIKSTPENAKMYMDLYAEKISKLEEVQAIYLFGSHANGEPHDESDLDFCVVVENMTDKEKIKMSMKIRKQLWGINKFPLDLCLDIEKDFDIAKNNELSMQYDIVRKGVLLYAKTGRP
jgi:predicted nucleotidyltransferase